MPPVSRRTSTGIRRPRVAGHTPAGLDDRSGSEAPDASQRRPGDTGRTDVAVEERPEATAAAVEDTAVEDAAVEDTAVEDAAVVDEPVVDPAPTAGTAAEPAAPRSRTGRLSLRKSAAEQGPDDDTAAPRGRKARMSLRAVAADDEQATATEAAPGSAEKGGRASWLAAPTSRKAVVAYGAVAAVCVAGAAFFGATWFTQEFTGPATNHALIDVGATAQVSQQVGDALKKIYSFDFARLDENEKDARAVITPEFQQQFEQIFSDVRARAPQQKAVVTATIANSAVREISGDTAVVVVFMDQLATRATTDNGQPQQLASAGRLTVTAKLVDGTWKVADVKAV